MRATYAHARDRREIRLRDGRTGWLLHISANPRIATVVIDGQRSRHPARWVSVISTHGPEQDGALICCLRPASEIPSEDRFTDDLEAITCPSFRPDRLEG